MHLYNLNQIRSKVLTSQFEKVYVLGHIFQKALPRHFIWSQVGAPHQLTQRSADRVSCLLSLSSDPICDGHGHAERKLRITSATIYLLQRLQRLLDGEGGFGRAALSNKS